MTAARYWRAISLQPFGGGDVELSEFQLIDAAGTRLDLPATLSSAFAPIAGTLGSLKDDNLGTVCRFAAKDVASPSFALVWDFGGSLADVAEGLLGSGNSRALMLSHFLLQRSSDGAIWTTELTAGAYRWNGANAWATGSSTTPMVWSETRKSSRVNLDASLRTASSSSGGYSSVLSSAAANSGKWYVEVTAPDGYGMPGLASANHPVETGYPGNNSQSMGLYYSELYIANAVTSISPISSSGTVGMMIDLDSRVLRYTNGVATSAPFNIPWSGPVYLATGNGSSGQPFNSKLNPGQDPFSYAVPPGYTAGFGALRVFDPLPLRSQLLPILLFVKSTSMPAFETRARDTINFKDMEFGGVGRIFGTVSRKNTPANVPLVRRVRLHRSRDGLLVRETWSKSDGTYEFSNVAPQYEYDVVAWDHELSYRSVVANNLKPEV
ncbi:hypothetical protein ACCQ08_24720 [Comamonas sp. SY3]|uniref:hypothetical protein n=1 Tax=Comamonas sp. SY3 TaxID=3243601 RepID=UPI003593D315